MTQIPTPQELLESAENEESRFDLEDYWLSIVTLRKRGWSWRDIADWLTGKGLQIDHSSVYRFAKNHKAVLWACLPQQDFENEATEYLLENTSQVIDSDDFSSAMAETNCCGFEIEEFEIGKLNLNENGLEFEACFVSHGDQLDDRAYSGNKIEGSILVSVSLDNSIDFQVCAGRADESEDFEE